MSNKLFLVDNFDNVKSLYDQISNCEEIIIFNNAELHSIKTLFNKKGLVMKDVSIVFVMKLAYDKFKKIMTLQNIYTELGFNETNEKLEMLKTVYNALHTPDTDESLLPKASLEQQNISNLLISYNVKVDAVAGSGKTTTALYIAKSFPHKNILLLTYNKRLKEETRIKLIKYDIRNLEVHNYHSFSNKYYTNTFNDENLEYVMNNITKYNQVSLPVYDIILIDEAQDISPLYYKLISHIISKTECPRIAIFGDVRQCIYDFKEANSKFLSMAEILYVNNTEWKNATLSETFRVPKLISTFINKCMIGNDVIVSNKEGNIRPKYISYHPFKEHKKIISLVKDLLLKYSPNDIFILAPSLRGDKSRVRILANDLSKDGIPIYVSGDNEKIDEDVIRDKITFSTFHVVKGLERKAVVVFSFDESYFMFFKKTAVREQCPNELYVATTRAMETLILVHDSTKNILPFINIDLVAKYCDMVGVISDDNDSQTKEDKRKISVCDLLRHLPHKVVIDALKYITINIITPAESPYTLTNKTKQQFGSENVADINGVAIPAYYEWKQKNTISIYRPDLIKYEMELDLKNITSADILYLANKWICHVSKYVYKDKQIKDYSWISDEEMTELCFRMKKNISDMADYEISLNGTVNDKTITGVADCIDNGILWEFKCVSKIESEHILQLALYAWMLSKHPYITIGTKVSVRGIEGIVSKIYKNGKYRIAGMNIPLCEIDVSKIKYSYRIFNILSNEIIEISASMEDLDKLVELIIEEKFKDKPIITDIEFLNSII